MTSYRSAAFDTYRRMALWALPFGLFFIFYFSLVFSPFVTFDSFHYLNLSLHPVVGDTHSMTFGWLLRLLAEFCDAVSRPDVFLVTFCAAQCLSMFVPLRALLRTVFQGLRIKPSVSNFHWAAVGVVGLYVLFVVPAQFLLGSAIWSDTLSFLVLWVDAIAVAVVLDTSKNRIFRIACGALMIALSPAAYHLRYQFILVPLALIGTGVIIAYQKRNLRLFWVAAVLGLFCLGSISASNRVLRRYFPSLEGTSQMVAHNALISAQCALGCQAHLYEKDCRTEEGRRLIEQTSCSDMVTGYASFGKPVVEVNSPVDVLRQLGPWLALKWLWWAPFRYLSDIHVHWGLEVGRFRFLQDDAAAVYPDAASRYSIYFPGTSEHPTPFFQWLWHLLIHVHFKWRAYHYLVALVTVANLALWKRGNALSLFLALVSIGTFLTFAYVNPHVPFRFLIQILVPGFLALGFTLRGMTVASPATERQEHQIGEAKVSVPTV